MTHYEFERIRSLVDDLCLIHIGWRTEEQQQEFLVAQDRIGNRALELRKQHEINRLKARIQELEGKP